jgi:hypothetical protein
MLFDNKEISLKRVSGNEWKFKGSTHDSFMVEVFLKEYMETVDFSIELNFPYWHLKLHNNVEAIMFHFEWLVANNKEK